VRELGREPTLTILMGAGPLERELGASLRDEISENLDAEVEVRVVPEEDLAEHQQSGEYQILASTWSAHYDDPAGFLAPQAPESPLDHLRSASPRYDELVSDAVSEKSGERRTRMLAEAERTLVAEEALVVPIYHPGTSYLIRPGVEDYVTPGYGTPVLYRHAEVHR